MLYSNIYREIPSQGRNILCSKVRKLSASTSIESVNSASTVLSEGLEEPTQARRGYIPIIHGFYAKTTYQFFTSKPAVEALIALLFSERWLVANQQTRLRHQKSVAQLAASLEVESRTFDSKEKTALAKSLNALSRLPRDLFEEAVSGRCEPQPLKLQFHYLYRQQIIAHSLDNGEIRSLQAFQNLMQYRFPHAMARILQPSLFWMLENSSRGRRRIADGAQAANITPQKSVEAAPRETKGGRTVKKRQQLKKSQVH